MAKVILEGQPHPRGRRVTVARVDPQDRDLFRDYSWLAYPPFWYIMRRGKSPAFKTIYLHRVIAARMLGRDLVPGEVVDHLTHDPKDNRRVCLRVGTQSQNMRNMRGPVKRNRSGTSGVSWDRASSKWVVRARHQGRYLWGGGFADLGDAVAASKALRASLGYTIHS